MFGKHVVFADKGPNYKIEREALHPLENLKVLDMLDFGMSIAVVRHHYGVNKSMICYIRKNKDKMWRSIKLGAPTHEKALV